MKCAVIIPVAPAEQDFLDDARNSVERAWAYGPGSFEGIEIIEVVTAVGATQAERRNRGIDLALEKDCAWIFFLDATDLMNLSAFVEHEACHAKFDAVWGNICESIIGVGDVVIRQQQILAMDRADAFLACAPDLTVGIGHFVRAECAAAVRFDVNEVSDQVIEYKYYLDLWTRFRCVKVPKILVIERVLTISPPSSIFRPGWSKDVERMILAKCDGRDLLCDVVFEDKPTKFLIDNPFDVIQHQHGKGEFFEIKELTTLRSLLGAGKTIVEVGANVGNHLVFYAQHMDARKIFPFEPNPDAVKLLTQNITINGLDGIIDDRGIGIGAGARYGRHSVVLPQDNNLGAAQLSHENGGSLEVFPLDDQLGDEKVDFMKIDVEGMEFEVLEGAARMIERNRPMLMVEVFRPKVAAFKAWCAARGYRIEVEFGYVNAVNFVAVAA